MGVVIICALIVSNNTAPISPSSLFLKKWSLTNGDKINTPKNAKKDRYQPMSDHKYKGFQPAVITAASKINSNGRNTRP